jgi:hypothetical protein
MINSSILNPITFKAVPTSNTYPNMWNTLHADRQQGNALIKPYYQKFQTNHVVYLQFESDLAVAPSIKSYNILTKAEIETIAATSVYQYGTTDVRYYTNFTITLDGDYTGKKFYFKLTQGSDILTSEPCVTADLTDLIQSGLMKYIKYTNAAKIDSDLPGVFIDWLHLPSTGHYLDFFVEAQDMEPNDTDESEVLEGSQSKTVISALYYSGRTLKSGPIPDYLCARMGVASSLDVFEVNGVQLIKSGGMDQSQFGGSTLYQISMKMTEKNTLGINVDSIGVSTPSTDPPIAGTPMYLGSVTSAAPDETEVKTMTDSTASATDQTVVYTISGARPCFAYPASFGALTSIIDTVGDEIISGFAIQTLDFTIDSDTISFKVYTFVNLATITAFSITYKF